ncbi:hypothetical protein AVEN_148953-1 [Araneus ventricosus]|uniref:Uncharacterized protein n=1 Tax=Araneus ventricosus TaxID=182803 RepID=A0A4Y2FPY5_ARAVE|nr:hypothetical protein AVEN_148953-1 [Araneus ventricosus]
MQTHFKKKEIVISLSYISRIKNLKLGSTKNDSKPIKNGRQSKLKKSDFQRLEKMASKPDPPTQASMAKALNVSQQVARLDSVNHGPSSQRRNGFSANGVTKPRFVQPGAKINSEYYIQKILKPFLKDDYCRLYPNGDAVLNQYSAPSQASRVIKKFLTDQQVQFLRPQQWMPNRPDSAPCDYFLWKHLENKLNKRRVSTLRCLQKAIREEVKKIPQEMILRALKSWPKRCKQSYYAEVRHTEKHLFYLCIRDLGW